ncbi:MAG: SpvB/TcaC N-terminal domain-containing protein [Kangiellaceae bacterium]
MTVYDVIEYKDSTTSYTVVANDTSALSLALSGRGDGDYTYRVRACNGYSWACSAYSSHSANLNVLFKPGTPASISNPSTDTDGTITIDWGVASGIVDEYRLEEQKNSGAWVQVQSGSTALTKTRTVGNGTFHYRVKACNNTGCSGFKTTTAVSEVRLKPSVPAAPTGPSTSTGSAATNWSSVTNATYYDLQKRNNNGSWSSAQNGDTNTSHTESGLTDGSWDFRVRACNTRSWSCSSYSAASTDTTVRLKPSSPATPTTTVTQSTNGSYSINWLKPSGTVSFYDLQERKDGGSWSTIANDTTALTKAVSGRATGDYDYRARACNGFGWACSAYSAVTADVLVKRIPGKPTISSPTDENDGDGEYTLGWSATSEATYYQLQRKVGSEGWTTISASQSGVSYSESVTDSDTYEYRVKACNGASWSCSGYSATKTMKVIIVPDYASAEPKTVADAVAISPVVPDNVAVGALEGQAGVSGGSATYSIPIALPPGRAGMQPSVSLNYSSKGGNGIAGVGWSLGVGSAISRCGRIADIDGVSMSVTFSAVDDRLCLDGQRLIVTSGDYGTSGAIYRTQMDRFVKVVQSGGINSSSSDFTVYHKDGKISYYGSTADSRHSPNGKSQNLSWAISEQQDQSGNTISYVYSEYADGEHLLDSIYYTGKDGQQGDRRVDFEYPSTDRDDRSKSYLAGGYTQQSKLLDKISTYYDSTKVREYRLDYSYSNRTDRALLDSVEECGYVNGVANCLAPTIMSHFTPDLEWEAVSSGSAANAIVDILASIQLDEHDDGEFTPEDNVILKDLNGDGIAEGLYLNQTVDTHGTFVYDITVFELDSGSYVEAASTIPSSLQWLIYAGVEGDINGDGITDFIANENGKLVYLQFDDNFKLTKYTTGFNLSANYDNFSASQGTQLMDIDADGYQDIVFSNLGINGVTEVAYYKNKANGDVDFTGPYTIKDLDYWDAGNGADRSTQKASLMDMNGDGLVDLVMSFNSASGVTDTSIGFSSLNSSGVLTIVEKTASQLGLPTNSFLNQYLWADLNGDGLKDYVRAVKTGSVYDWKFRFNQGNKTFSAEQSLSTNVGIHEWPVKIDLGESMRIQAKFGGAQAVDIDGDGKDELLVATGSADDYCVNAGGWETNPANGEVSDMVMLTSCNDNIHLNAHINTENPPEELNIDLSSYDLRRFDWSIVDFEQTGQNDIRHARTVADVVSAPITNSFFFGGKSVKALQLKDFNNDGLVDFNYRTITSTNFQGNYQMGSKYITLGFIGGSFQANSPAIVDGYFVQENLAEHSTRQSDTLYQVEDGLGKVARWDYAPISRPENVNGSDLYTVPDVRYIDQDENGQHFYFTSSMPVVTNFHESNGIGGEIETTYRYKEAIYNRRGRGFQGFRTIIVDNQSGIRSVTDFSQIFPFAGKIDEARTCLSTSDELCSGNLLSKTTIEYFDKETDQTSDPVTGTSIALNDDVYWIVPSSQIAISRDVTTQKILSQKTSTLSELDVDNYGNILRSESLVDSGKSNFFSEVKSVTVNNYTNDSTNWWFKLDDSTVTVETLTGSTLHDALLDPKKEIKTSYTYTANRQPDVVTVEPKLGGGFASTIDTDYNTYGLPTRVTTTSQGVSRSIVTTYSNDGEIVSGDGYFVYEVTNDLNHKVTTKTYPEHGQVKEVIDANDLITKTEYDAFGRIEKVTPPNGTGQPAYSRFADCLGGCDDVTYITPSEIGSNGVTNIASLISYKVTTYSAGSPETTLYKDKFNRVLVAVTEGFDGSPIFVRTEYDGLGRKVFESIPYFLVDETFLKDKGTHWVSFDEQGRLLEKKIDQPDRFGASQSFTTTYSYDEHETTVQAIGSTGKTLNMTRTYNGIGQLMKTKDALNGITEYAYDAQGNPIVLQDANNNPITAEYNALGQKQYVIDPNMGRKDFEYTAFGEIYREKDANNDSYYYDYDVLGRLTHRYLNVIPSASNQHLSEASFEFDGVCNGAIDREVREDLTGGENFSRDYYYDSSCRGSSMTTTIDGVSYTQATQYDSFYGRVKGSQTVSGITLETQYNDFGYATKSLNAASGYVYQEVTDMDARLQLIAANKANGQIIETRKYSEITGQMELVKAETLSQMQRHRIAYEYDDFGNLALQNVEEMLSDFSVNVFDETYRYDNLHRLVESKRTASGAEDILNYNYDAVGNITVKDDFSTNFTYGNLARNNGNAGPNAVRQVVKTSEFNNEVVTYGYDLNGNMTSGDGRTITYNAFNKPVSIVKGSITSLFSYDSGQMRYKQIKQGLSGGDETTIYIDKSYEEITHNGVTKKRSYLGDAIVTETVGGTEAGFKVGFVHRDRLGSVVTITNELGALEDNKSFDPFGKVRKGDMKRVDPSNLATLSVVAELDGYDLHTNRGFTDHEHLDDAELIHMNGRVYDYNLGRFLSVDPFIQSPGNSQSMNPYSYIMNNPLAGTDPSGYVSVKKGDKIVCDDNPTLCKKIYKELTRDNGKKQQHTGDINAFEKVAEILGGGEKANRSTLTPHLQGRIEKGRNKKSSTGSTSEEAAPQTSGGNDVEVTRSGNLTSYGEISVDWINAVENGHLEHINNIIFSFLNEEGRDFSQTNVSALLSQLMIVNTVVDDNPYSAGGVSGVEAAILFLTKGKVKRGLGWQNQKYKHAVQPFSSKGALTRAGRALTKHPNIVGLRGVPKGQVMGALKQRFGSDIGVNNAAAFALRHIMRTGKQNTKNTEKFGKVVDYKLENGLGARFTVDSNQFIGFLGREL